MTETTDGGRENSGDVPGLLALSEDSAAAGRPLHELARRWQKEAKHWQDRADSAGATRHFAAAYEYMTRAEQYASCAVQLQIAMTAMSAERADGA